MRRKINNHNFLKSTNGPRSAFTLIEILIVVIVLGVLAAIVVPRFSGAADGAVDAAVEANVHSLNTQAEILFRTHQAKHAPESEWITTLVKLKATVNEQLLADWTISGETFIAPNDKRFAFNAETSSSAAKILEETEETTSTAGDESDPQNGDDSSSGTSTEGYTQEQIQALTGDDLLNASLTPEQMAWLTTDQLAEFSEYDLASLTAEQIAALTADQINSLSYGQFEAIVGALSPDQLSAARPQLVAACSDDVFNALSADQVAALTEAQLAERAIADDVRQLRYSQFESLPPEHIPYLTPEQIASIPSNWYMGKLSDEQRAELTKAQVQALNTADISLGHLTAAQMEYLTDDQYASIGQISSIAYVPPDKVALLSTDVIGSISSDWYMGQYPDEVKAAFTAEQVQALNTAVISTGHLTEAQREYLTDEQYAAIGAISSIAYVPPEKVPLLSTEVIGKIRSDWYMDQYPDEVIAAFTAEQVQALNTAVISTGHLTEAQRQYLTDDQYASIGSISSIAYVPPEKVYLLSTDVISDIPSDWYMSRYPEEVRAALTTEQVQALDTSSVSIKYLTETQRSDLTTGQVQNVRSSDIANLSATQIPLVTTTQISGLTSSYYFNMIPDSSLHAMTREQVLAVNDSLYENHKDRFTAEQQSWR